MARPKQTPPDPTKVRTSIYLDETLLQAVGQVAEAEDRSANYIIERAIKRDLANQAEPKTAAA